MVQLRKLDMLVRLLRDRNLLRKLWHSWNSRLIPVVDVLRILSKFLHFEFLRVFLLDLKISCFFSWQVDILLVKALCLNLSKVVLEHILLRHHVKLIWVSQILIHFVLLLVKFLFVVLILELGWHHSLRARRRHHLRKNSLMFQCPIISLEIAASNEARSLVLLKTLGQSPLVVLNWLSIWAHKVRRLLTAWSDFCHCLIELMS